MPKILAENLGGEFLRKIYAENLGGKFLRKILAENLGPSQNLCRYTEFMHLVKFKHAIELWRTLKSPRLGKVSAPNQNLGRKVWRLLTIWARQNLQLLTSSWSG